jgi:parallel beta-helix repeat protein
MTKNKVISKIFGIALVFVMVGSMLGGIIGTAAAAKFSIGDTVKVTDNLNVRTSPGTSYPEITDPDYPGYAPAGTIGEILGGPSSADGYIWWEVDYGPGLYSGWSVEDWLEKVTPCPHSCWDRSPLSGNELAALVRNHFPLGGVTQTGESIRVTAYAIAKAESGGNPSACGAAGEIGLWQIYPDAHPEYDQCRLFEEDYNANAAEEISNNGKDWNPWCTWEETACGGNGNEAYKQYLTEARKHFYPKVTSLSVSQASINLGEALKIYYSVSDDVGLDRVELWRTTDKNGSPDDSNWGKVKQVSISGTTYSDYFTDAATSPGIYWYGIHVVDNSGAPEAWNDEQNSRTGGLPGDFGPIQVEIIQGNSPPQLSNGYVAPSSGTPSTDFYYYVTYFDPDGDSPSVKQVIIDGTAYTMSSYLYEDSRIIYRYGPKNLSAGGTHYYFFYFEDGRGGWDRLPSGVDMYLGPSVTPETYPPQVTTEGASSITTSSATLTGNLDNTGGETCQVWFEYGTTTSYGSSTTKLSMSLTGPFSAIISTLSDDTTYHFRACASNSKGTRYGSDKTFTTGTGEVVTFPDPNLEAAIRDAIGKPTGDIYQSDLEGLTTFHAHDGGISNLTGLEWCINLQGLYLEWNQISDISTLSSLINLTSLYLYENQISDLTPISNLARLVELSLKDNQINDIQPLANLTNLAYLVLWGNQLSHLQPLANLTNLTGLDLCVNQISDISPLANLTNLQSLNLGRNQVSDLQPLFNLTNLTRLWLYSNQISDISPASNLTSLTSLYLHDNQISDIKPLVDNSGLAAADQVNLRSNPLSAISINTYIPQLEARGVTVYYDAPVTRTWYVDDDLVDCPAPDFTTIQEAVDAASSGDTIIVYPGTYTENVDVNKSHLAIQSQNGAGSTIVQAANSDDHVFEVTADYVNIGGFTVEGATGSDKAGIYLNYAVHCEISNDMILNSSYGIYLNDSSYNNVTGNTVKSCVDAGIILDYLPTPGPYLPAVGHNIDVGDQPDRAYPWEDEPLSYDGDTTTFTKSKVSQTSWTAWLELFPPTEKSQGVRFWIDAQSEEYFFKVDILYSDSESWDCLKNWAWPYDATPRGEWVMLDYPRGERSVEKVRVKFHSTFWGSPREVRLNEFQFKTTLGVPCSNNDIVRNTVSNNGVGIRLYRSSNNRIYFNNFINNTDNGYSSGSHNICNSPEEKTYTYNGNTYTSCLGNYWSDYGEYLLPVGHNDSAEQWSDAALAYDGDLDTYARTWVHGPHDSSWLELVAPPGKVTQGVRFRVSWSLLRVELYYDGSWHCHGDWNWPYTNAPTNQWVELDYPPEIVEKARFKFYSFVGVNDCHLHEVQFKTVVDENVIDANGDGIGDTPYSIDSDSDNYPLVEPFENYEIGAPINNAPIANASDISGQPDIMYPDEVYSVTARYYDPDGRGDLKYCYLRLTHPEKTLTMMWEQSTGNYYPWASEEGANYLTINDVTNTTITDEYEGYQLTWNFSINASWPEAENSIDFGVFASDYGNLKSGWEYDDTDASFVVDLVRYLIQQERIVEKDVHVTVDGDQYIIATLTNTIDPEMLKVIPDSGETTVYVDMEGNPISDGEIVRKIGLIETARNKAGEIDITARINELEEIQSEMSTFNLLDLSWGGINLAISAGADLEKIVSEMQVIERSTDVLSNFQKIKDLAKTQPTGILVKSITYIMRKIIWDPMNEAKIDIQNQLSSAINDYDSAQNVLNEHDEIEDFQAANEFLTNLYHGEAHEEAVLYLFEKIFTNYGLIVLRIEPLSGALTFGLSEFVKLVGEAAEVFQWENDVTCQYIVEEYTIQAELLYGLSESAEYTLELTESYSEIGTYRLKYLQYENEGYEASAECYQSVADYLGGFDPGDFFSSLKRIKLFSPAELRVFDLQGQVTGTVNGQTEEQIPNSVYEDENKLVVIFSPSNFYRYQVVGTEEGTYGLEVNSVEAGEVTNFTATDIPTSANATHQYTINWSALSRGEEGVTVQMDSDGDGEFEQTVTADATLQPPVAEANGPYEGNEGSPISFSGSGSYDPDGNITLYEWDFDSDGTYDIDSTSSNITHTWDDDYNGTVVLRVTDDDGLTSVDTTEVTVNNVPPAVEAGPNITAECCVDEISLNASFTDPSSLDTHTATIDWGDGTNETGTVNEIEGTVSGSHTYTGCGTFTLTLTVTDDDGGIGVDAATVTVVDTTPPEVKIEVPMEDAALQDGVTLTATASDFCGVADTYFYVREPNGTGIPIGYENLMATLNSSTGKWECLFDTTLLSDGYYVVLAKAVDNYSNEGWSEVVPFSIRNWAVLELLPASQSNKGGRTVPVKFSLRIAESVDPAQPFVYNEELEIRIYDASDNTTILQTSLYGDTSRDYRIDSVGEKYITNFKTKKQPAMYTVEIWRTSKNFLIGSFTFETVK